MRNSQVADSGRRHHTPPLVKGCTLAALACAALALACSTTKTPETVEKPKPQYGPWGFDIAGADPNTRPGDDFFRYANGRWLDTTEIPPDKPATSLRLAMSDLTEERLHQILERAAAKTEHEPSSLDGKVGAFYRSFMDERRIEADGAKPIAPQLDAVRAATSLTAIAALMGRHNSDFESALFELFIDVDFKDPRRYAVYVSQAGLGLPDRDYYSAPGFASQKAQYQSYAATLLHLIEWPAAETRAQKIVEFETRVAQASWTKTQSRDPVTTYNPMTIDELQRLAPGFPWRPYLQQAGLGDLPRIIVGQKSAFPKLAAIFAATPLDTLRAWLAFRIADNSAPYLSRPFVDAHFELRGKVLSGQPSPQVRWKRGVHAVGGGDASGGRSETFGNLGWGLGQLYTAQYFPPEAKRQIEALVANLTSAYRARIEKLDWMGPATRAEALKKLNTYSIKVGYPNRPRDYSAVVVRDDDVVGNVQRAAVADWAFYVSRLNGPVDRDDWIMTPQTNNAYNGSLRDIVFPAGILQPPIFDPNADPAINYGAAGGVIGHELTHGFDDQGRKIDADGALRDWWTAADATAFDARARKLGAQYSSFEPLPGARVNGELTMGENIADLGGLALALDAYRASLGGKPAPVLDGLTGDQRVMLGWAQAWRGKTRDEGIRRQVVSDPHSPRQYRVNGVVRNLDDWYASFGVKPGERLFLAPPDRVRIW